jgi:predicted transcriptional regulator with HTH domain
MPKRLGSEIPELTTYGLRTIFGDNVRTRILDFLTLYRNSEYSMSEIARNSHVSWRSFNREFPVLIELGLVKQVGLSGNAKLYKYSNPGNAFAECLVKLANEVALQAAKKNNIE